MYKQIAASAPPRQDRGEHVSSVLRELQLATRHGPAGRRSTDSSESDEVLTRSRPQPAAVRAAATRTVSLYFLRGEKLGVAHERVARSAAPVAAALRLLVRGPSPAERAAGLASQIPVGSRLRSVTLAEGVASVD